MDNLEVISLLDLIQNNYNKETPPTTVKIDDKNIGIRDMYKVLKEKMAV